jgi:virulence-associated protein VagC
MESVVLPAEALNLPSAVAGRYRGRSLRIVDEGERIVITPVNDIISSARGMLKGLDYSTGQFMRDKQAEKDLENA